MDKKEFLKALLIVGLINTICAIFIAMLIFLIVIAVNTAPFVFLVILLFLIIGYSSAFIYLKLKEKK